MVIALPIIRGLFITSLSLLSLARASAQDIVATKLRSCASIAADIDRLVCFDKAFSRASAQISSPSANPAARSAAPVGGITVPEDQIGWSHKETTSGMDNSKTELAILPAATTRISRVGGLPQHAALIIRCQEGRTELYIAYSDIVDGMEHSINVQYRVGNASVKKERWGISQDYQSYGTWQTSATIALVKSLLSADEFYVRGDAGSMGTSEASFKLAGIEEAVAPVKSACHW